MAELESTEEMQRAFDESVTDAHSAVRARYQHLHIDTTRGGEEADTLREDTYVEIDHYSITPRTFESRTYDDFAGIYGLIYRDEFAFNSNRVTRFGINSKSPNLRDILVQDGMEFYNLNAPESTVRSRGYRPEEARQIQLANIEQELFR